MLDEYQLQRDIQALQQQAIADNLETHFMLKVGKTGRYKISRNRLMNHSERLIKQLLRPPVPAKLATSRRNGKGLAPPHLRLQVWLDNNPEYQTRVLLDDIQFMADYEDKSDALRAEIKTVKHDVQTYKEHLRDAVKPMNKARKSIHRFINGKGKRQDVSPMIADWLLHAHKIDHLETTLSQYVYELTAAQSQLKAHTGWKKKAAQGRIKQALEGI